MKNIGGKVPPTYDNPGQATPGYKVKLPTPTPKAQGRVANPRGNYKTGKDTRGSR